MAWAFTNVKGLVLNLLGAIVASQLCRKMFFFHNCVQKFWGRMS